MVWRDRRLLWALIQGRGKILRSSLVILSSWYGLLPAPCAGYSETHSLAFNSHYTFKRVFKHLASGCKLHRSLKVTYGNAAHQGACAVFQIWPNALQGRPFSQLPNSAYIRFRTAITQQEISTLKGPLCVPSTSFAMLGEMLAQTETMVKKVERKNIRTEEQNRISSSSISSAIFTSWQ